jgi:hypothetical protein
MISREEAVDSANMVMDIVGGQTSARRKPYKNDTRKPSNGTTSRTHM